MKYITGLGFNENYSKENTKDSSDSKLGIKGIINVNGVYRATPTRAFVDTMVQENPIYIDEHKFGAIDKETLFTYVTIIKTCKNMGSIDLKLTKMYGQEWKRWVDNYINILTIRIPEILEVRTCSIQFNNLSIGLLSIEENDFGQEDWVIKPNYSNIDNIRKSEYVEIPGINIDTRDTLYIRRFIPEVVSQRIPPKNRIDVPEILQGFGMQYYDAFELMCRSGGRCPCNNLEIKRIENENLFLED